MELVVSSTILEARRKQLKDRAPESTAAAWYACLGLEHTQEDSLDWLLYRDALLLPTRNTRGTVQSLAAFAPVWRGFRKDSDLEQGLGDCWQIADARDIYPRTDK